MTLPISQRFDLPAREDITAIGEVGREAPGSHRSLGGAPQCMQ